MSIEVSDATRAALQAELVPAGILWASFGEIHTLDGAPFGTRLIVDVTDVRIEGPGLNARMKGQATADWGSLAADGTFQLDVRATLETDDGALILAQYHGRCDFTNPEAPGPVYATPRFETGDPRYAWLNKVQAVMKGHVELPTQITYQIYVVK
jgi:hypothetical protein